MTPITNNVGLSRNQVRERIERLVVKVQHCRETLYLQLCEIQSLVDEGAPKALDCTAEEFYWMVGKRIGKSGSHLMELLEQRTKLLEAGASAKQIVEIHETDAKVLKKLPVEYRRKLLPIAVKTPGKPFQDECKAFIEKKTGGLKDEWRTFSWPLPVTDYDMMQNAFEVISAFMGLNVSLALREDNPTQWKANIKEVAHQFGTRIDEMTPEEIAEWLRPALVGGKQD